MIVSGNIFADSSMTNPQHAQTALVLTGMRTIYFSAAPDLDDSKTRMLPNTNNPRVSVIGVCQRRNFT